MANGHGGKRAGAGRPRKPLADKILEDDIKKHKAKVLNFEGAAFPQEPPDWMPYYGSRTAGTPDADDIYKTTAAWLERTGCGHLVNPDFVQDYAIVKASFYEAQRIITKLGLYYVIEDDKGNKRMCTNPMITVAKDYFKLSNEAWGKIWAIIAQNCAEDFSGDSPNADIMEKLLRMNLDD